MSTCPPPSEGLLTTVAWDLGEHGGSSPRWPTPSRGRCSSPGRPSSGCATGSGSSTTAAGIGPSGPAGRGQRGRVRGARLHRARQPVVGPLRARDHHRPHAGHRRGAHRPGRGRGHGVPGARRRRRHDVRAGTALAALRVDGGAAVLDLLLQIQADQLRVPVPRPATTETTALGAATLAGLAEGVWATLDDLRVDLVARGRVRGPRATRWPPTAALRRLAPRRGAVPAGGPAPQTS